MDLGKRLRDLRRERGEALLAVAREVGVAPNTYRGWENGTRPNEAQWAAIARRLGCTVAEVEKAAGPHHVTARAAPVAT